MITIVRFDFLKFRDRLIGSVDFCNMVDVFFHSLPTMVVNSIFDILLIGVKLLLLIFLIIVSL